MGWIITLIIGGLIGWHASIVITTNVQMGLIANVLVGVVGSLLGSLAAVGLVILASSGRPEAAKGRQQEA